MGQWGPASQRLGGPGGHLQLWYRHTRGGTILQHRDGLLRERHWAGQRPAFLVLSQHPSNHHSLHPALLLLPADHQNGQSRRGGGRGICHLYPNDQQLRKRPEQRPGLGHPALQCHLWKQQSAPVSEFQSLFRLEHRVHGGQPDLLRDDHRHRERRSPERDFGDQRGQRPGHRRGALPVGPCRLPCFQPRHRIRQVRQSHHGVARRARHL